MPGFGNIIDVDNLTAQPGMVVISRVTGSFCVGDQAAATLPEGGLTATTALECCEITDFTVRQDTGG